MLKRIQNQLFSSSYFFFGDSAYAIESFIIPPYDNAKPKSYEDAFNFYHSSARITVQCAFGEIDRRWGVFWSAIAYSLNNTCIICEGAMHLHNFILEHRLSSTEAAVETAIETEIFDTDRYDYGVISEAVTNDAIRPGDRPSNDEILCRQNGLFLRDHLKYKLANYNMIRPTKQT